MSRARRRADLQRVKTKAKQVMRRLIPDDQARADEIANKIANHLKACGCLMCKNPRRAGWKEDKSIQELRAEQTEE